MIRRVCQRCGKKFAAVPILCRVDAMLEAFAAHECAPVAADVRPVLAGSAS